MMHAMRMPTPRRPGVVLLFAIVLLAAGLPAADGGRPLSDRVTIVRDVYGVAHIQAETEEAAGFGLGYAQAEDHIEFMARRVLEARGEAARHFGPSYLENDFAVKRLANLEESRRHLDDLDGTYRKVLEAFAAGANHYVALHRDELPAWVPVFSAADFVATPRAGTVRGVSSASLVRSLQAKYRTTTTTVAGGVVHRIETAGDEDAESYSSDDVGSNALAISGSRTVTVEVLQEDGTLKVESRTYWDSHLGPIVCQTPGFAFAYRSSALDAWRFFEGFWRLSHAKNLREFMKVMEKRLLPTSNYTYADADGNVLYLWNARLPKRRAGEVDYSLDVPAEPRYVWRSLHDIGDLPQLLNPRGGYVQNANNPPWFVSRLDPIAADRFPDYFERGEMALRPQLAVDLLGRREKFTVDDVRDLKYSTRLLLAERVKDDLLAAVEGVENPSADLAEGAAIVSAWDNAASADSVGAVLFQRFWDTYRAAVEEPFRRPWDEAAPFDTPSGLSDPALAARHLEEAVRWVRETYGTARVKWGDVNRFRFGALDLPGNGAPGTLGAYRVLSFERADDGCRVAGRLVPDGDFLGTGDAWVLLVHFTRPVEAYSVLAYGQSSRPASPHGTDQISIFAERKLRPVFFRPEDIELNAERRYRP